MFYLSRRQAHAALAGVATAAAWLAAAELGSKRPVRVTGLLVLGMTAMAGMAASGSQAKAVSAHRRIDLLVPDVAQAKDDAAQASTDALTGKNFVNNGGTVGGNVTVDGDHHVYGDLYGSGGVISSSDKFQTTATGSGSISSHGQIYTSNNLWADGLVNGAGIPVSIDGNSQATTVTALRDYVNTQLGHLKDAGLCQ